MGVGSYGTEAELTAQVGETSRLHDGGIWLEEILWTRLTRKKAGNIGKQAVVGHGKHMGVVDTGEDERLMAVGDDEEKLLALVVNRHDVYLRGGG